jgi:pyrroline-5-carboxylate reductase
VNVCSDLEDLMAHCQVVVLATKPFVVNEVLDSIQDKVRNHLIVSILAGVSTQKIELKLFNTRTVRVMPNTPALVGYGMSAVCGGKFAFDYDVKYVLEMFSSLGRAIEIDEKYIDIVTAISGSGPAFFYYFIDKIALQAKNWALITSCA